MARECPIINSCHNFIFGLLELDVNARMTAAEIKHPWISQKVKQP